MPNNLDPSYKMDLDFLDYFGMKKLCLISKEYGIVGHSTHVILFEGLWNMLNCCCIGQLYTNR